MDLVSSNAVNLSEGVVKAMLVTKYKTSVVTLFAVLFCIPLVVAVAQTNGPGDKQQTDRVKNLVTVPDHQGPRI